MARQAQCWSAGGGASTVLVLVVVKFVSTAQLVKLVVHSKRQCAPTFVS